MEFVWFCFLAIFITGYVLLDGYDLGTGMLHLFVATNDQERRQVVQTIGPVWDGNEVWLIAGGGVLFLAFPILYASSFSGFYLPLMIVLWLLLLRGISLEFRSHLSNPLWRQFWDVGFAGASGLLAFFFGVALGNVVRGVPLDEAGNFFLPLWFNFQVVARAGVLDWYTTLVGILTFVTLAEHGALWLAYRTEGPVQERAARAARRLWPAVVTMVAVVTFFTFRIQPQVGSNLMARPWGFVFPAIAVAGLLGIILLAARGDDAKAFASSAAYIFGMLTSVAFGLFPYVLPSIPDPSRGLTIYNAAASEYGLTVALGWFIPGMILAVGYTILVHRKLTGRVKLGDEGHC